MRIELTTTAWEAVVLPLNYTCEITATVYDYRLHIVKRFLRF